jgi:hypothetical protein
MPLRRRPGRHHRSLYAGTYNATVGSEEDTRTPARMLVADNPSHQFALSAWESVPSGPVTWPDLQISLSAGDRERPLFTGVNGPLMAR